MKSVFDFAKQTVFLARDVQQCKADIKTLQQEIRDLTAIVQRLAYDAQRDRDNEQHEREKLLLRLENLLLRSEHRLPSSTTQEEKDKDAQIASLLRENEELRRQLEQRDKE